MSQPVNHFRIKRQAHTLLRRDTGPNPFTRIPWIRRESSRSSLPQSYGHEEAQIGVEPIQQIRTAPSPLASDEPPGVEAASTNRPGPSKGAEDEEVRHDAAWKDSLEVPHTDGDRSGPRPTPSPAVSEDAEGSGKRGKEVEFGFIKQVEPLSPFTVANQIQRTILARWLNVFLLCVPAGFSLYYVRGKSVESFVVNMVATVPLLFLNGDALEDISLRVGDQIGEMIYIFTCNLVQLITCILLIANNQGTLVQLSVVGGILANLLLILGASIVAGGWNRRYQYFQKSVAHVSSNLLSLSATSLLVPTATSLLAQVTQEDLARQSRGAAVILIIVYVSYLFYQLKTHKDDFEEETQKVPTSRKLPDGTVMRGFVAPAGVIAPVVFDGPENQRFAGFLQPSSWVPEQKEAAGDDEPHLHFLVALFSFTATTVLLYFCVDFAVNSIDELTSKTMVSKTFVGLILLPLPNCDFSAVAAASVDKLDTAMICTIGKCLQTALLVTPVAVLVAWGVGVNNVTLVFDGFEVISLFAAVLLLNFMMTEGRVSWVQGILLLSDWGLIALAAYFATI